jgi:hypothetical protein
MSVLTSETVAPLIRKHHGNLAAVGRELGCDRRAAHRFAKARPKLREICHERSESRKAFAESSLYRAVLEGNLKAVMFYLRMQARDRGYIERHEVEEVARTRLEIVTVRADLPEPDVVVGTTPMGNGEAIQPRP